MGQSGVSGPERRVVRVADIVEFPTALGSRCALLRELGLSAYRDTEEELLDALTRSAEDPRWLEVCLTDSRCRAFWDVFQQGRTPFAEFDPVRLHEHGGRYWVVEGKHRVCLAKRAGVKELEAVVYPLAEDVLSLLPRQGEPGCFRFRFTCQRRGRKVEGARGEVAFLWVEDPELSESFAGGQVWLTASQDTGGRFREVVPGLRYRVSVARKRLCWRPFCSREEIAVDAEVVVAEGHRRTKIWLMTVRAAEVPGLGAGFAGPPAFETVYRFGCWRRGHLRQLRHVYRFF